MTRFRNLSGGAVVALVAVIGFGCESSGGEEPSLSSIEVSTTSTTSVEDVVDSLPEFPYSMEEWRALVANDTVRFRPEFLEGLGVAVGEAWGLRYGFTVEVLEVGDGATMERRYNRLRLRVGEDGLVSSATTASG